MKLFYYEHCPFCTRVLMLIHCKRLDVECIVLLNDDEETPISMIGQKMVPILQKDDGSYLAESLDIIHYLDNLDKPVLPAHHEPQAVLNWLSETRVPRCKLTYPRMIQYPFKEFATQSARDYFERKKSKTTGPFVDCIAETTELLTDFQPHLDALSMVLAIEPMDGISWKDIYLFPYLLALTLIPGIKLPTAVAQFLQQKGAQYQFPSYDANKCH